MKPVIEAALSPLIGEPLSDIWRYAGCQKFEFGIQRPTTNHEGEEITLADWGLVVSCDWRVTGPEGHVVSSGDFGFGGSRRDEQAHPFYDRIHADSPVVESVGADDDGKLSIRMSRGYLLQVDPVTGIDPEDEQWRFTPKDEEARHVVLWGDGIDGVEEGERAAE